MGSSKREEEADTSVSYVLTPPNPSYSSICYRKLWNPLTSQSPPISSFHPAPQAIFSIHPVINGPFQKTGPKGSRALGDVIALQSPGLIPLHFKMRNLLFSSLADALNSWRGRPSLSAFTCKSEPEENREDRVSGNKMCVVSLLLHRNPVCCVNRAKLETWRHSGRRWAIIAFK